VMAGTTSNFGACNPKTHNTPPQMVSVVGQPDESSHPSRSGSDDRRQDGRSRRNSERVPVPHEERTAK
jgi:hypothetical protein